MEIGQGLPEEALGRLEGLESQQEGEDLHEGGSQGGEKVDFAEVGLEIWGWGYLRSPWQSGEVCEERVLGERWVIRC